MAKQNDTVKSSESVAPSDPQTAHDFIESGWTHYSKKEYFRAESDFQKALGFDPSDVDTQYALAMTLMASARPQEATTAFEKVLSLLRDVQEKDAVRAHMLGRLAQGHINRIQTGDWGIIS